MGTKLAETICFDIEDELTDRKGFTPWWDSLDESTRHEIRGMIIGIIDNNIEREASLCDEVNSELNMLANKCQESSDV